MQTLRAMVSSLGGFSAWRVQSGRVQSGRVQSGRVAMRSGTCGRVWQMVRSPRVAVTQRYKQVLHRHN